MRETLGIVGSGPMGRALGRRFSDSGYAIAFGIRAPGTVVDLVEELPGVSAHPVEELATRTEIIFLAVPGTVAPNDAHLLGDLRGKVLVDCTYPMSWDEGPIWSPPAEGSVTAALVERIPGVRAVKAFNTFGVEFHADPDLGAQRVQVLMAGDDDAAKEDVAAIATASGFEPIDAGPLRNAALLENQAILWVHMALVSGRGRDFVFQMTSRG